MRGIFGCYLPCDGSRLASRSRDEGFTLLELLIALAVFAVLLTAALSVFVTSNRAQRAAEMQSLRTQQTEAVVHLVNYEVGLAGYGGTQNPRTFASSEATIEVVLGSSSGNGDDGPSDTIAIRYFEDDDFLHEDDDGLRHVRYSVTGGRLVRENLIANSVEELVDDVSEMRIVSFIGRDRSELDDNELEDADIGGVRVLVRFLDTSEWTFFVGLYNQQNVDIK